MDNKKAQKIIEKIEVQIDDLKKVLSINRASRFVNKMQKGDTQQKVKEVNFSKNPQAFIREYAQEMSGPKKFTLLLAMLTKGDLSKGIPQKEIKERWNKMTAKNLLGGEFNRFYSAEARGKDWVEPSEEGYRLKKSWKEIFEN